MLTVFHLQNSNEKKKRKKSRQWHTSISGARGNTGVHIHKTASVFIRERTWSFDLENGSTAHKHTFTYQLKCIYLNNFGSPQQSAPQAINPSGRREVFCLLILLVINCAHCLVILTAPSHLMRHSNRLSSLLCPS